MMVSRHRGCKEDGEQTPRLQRWWWADTEAAKMIKMTKCDEDDEDTVTLWWQNITSGSMVNRCPTDCTIKVPTFGYSAHGQKGYFILRFVVKDQMCWFSIMKSSEHMLKLDMIAESKVQMMTSFASLHQSLMPIQLHLDSTLQTYNISYYKRTSTSFMLMLTWLHIIHPIGLSNWWNLSACLPNLVKHSSHVVRRRITFPLKVMSTMTTSLPVCRTGLSIGRHV